MKNKLHRFIALFLVLVLTATLFLSSVTASAVTEDRRIRTYRGTFSYLGGKDNFYYSDSYFFNPGDVVNEHLRTLSAAVAFCVGSTSDQSIVDMMTDMGMDTDSIVSEDIVQGTKDTIGTVIAHKYIKEEVPLVLIAVRGMDYAGEWASNFSAGTEGDPTGFSEAAAKVDLRLREYLDDYDLNDAKIWICGYSRAGGVANLLGRYLNEAPDDYGISKDDIFVYTFEAPRSSADDAVYKNIHNIMDVRDLVPRLYPEDWGIYLNGAVETIGDPEETVMTKYFSLSADGYIADYKELTKSQFLSQFVSFVASAVSREDYEQYAEPYLSELSSIVFAKSYEERSELLSYLSEVGSLIQEYPKLNAVALGVLIKPYTEGNINNVSNMLTSCLESARETTEPPFTDEEFDTLLAAVNPLVRFVLKMEDPDANYTELNENGKKVYLPLYHIVTLLTNISDFIQPHIFTNVFELLKEEDSYYTAGIRIKPGDVYVGDTCYTYEQYGGPLEDIALNFGFTKDDINTWLKNGFDLHINNVITEIEPDDELYFRAAGMVDKSMNMYKFYDVTMTKTLGYRTYPLDTPVTLKENPICLVFPKEQAEKCFRFGVVRVDGKTARRIDRKIVKKDNGDIELWVNCEHPAVYASAFDDHRWWTSADVDKDDDVTSVDATHIQRHLAKMEDFDDYQLNAADVDTDGEVTPVDVTYIQRWLSRMSAPDSIGEKFGDYEE